MSHPVTRAALAAICVLCLAACGSGAPTVASAPPGADPGTPPPATTQAPTISLPRESVVLVARELALATTASDPGGRPLTFKVSNKPGWMKFSSSTGELRGTPAPVHVGTYSNIRVTVSNGESESSAETTVRVVASADGRATLSWSAPTERTDGSPLTNLAGFRIYYGPTKSDLRYVIDIKDPGARSWVVEDLTPGRWYFAASAFDSQNLESGRSNAASKAI